MQLVELPNRRVEAWKYSDLRAALDEPTAASLKRDRGAPEVQSALRRGGVIGALAAQLGVAEQLSVGAGEHVVRIDRVERTELKPHLLDVSIAPGGKFTRVVLQPAGDAIALDAAHVRVGANSCFQQIVLTEGAKLARIETDVRVEGEGAEVELNGVYMAGAGRHADLTSTIEHTTPGGVTRQLIKGVARKGGRGVFQGKIVVAPQAQKTDARQYHHGMLLEDGAEIFAKPELMIHADDVQCAHGNTAGGLDAGALFYLRSRGVPEAEARALLIEAFLADAIPEWTPTAARGEIEDRIRVWLRGDR